MRGVICSISRLSLKPILISNKVRLTLDLEACTNTVSPFSTPAFTHQHTVLMKSRSLQFRLLITGIACTLVPLILIGVVTQYEGKQIASVSKDAMLELAHSELTNMNRDALSQVAIVRKLLENQVSKSLGVARDELQERGGFLLDPNEKVEWEAINQFSKNKSKIRLPRAMLGNGQWLGQVKSMDTYVPVVDDLGQITGDTATLFQRMNEAGDMLRVATNVEKAGERAVGTYIPSDSPVVQTVLSGNTFIGRAFVVNQWYVTAYQPLFDEKRQVIGILYAGVPERIATDALLDSLSKITVGQTGYIFILNTIDDKAGDYVLSKDRVSDGKNVLGARDNDGRAFVQVMVDATKEMSEGEIREIRYPWQNKGETAPRDKVAYYTYFEPWDWLIAVSAYEDDFFAGVHKVSSLIDDTMTAIVVLTLSAGIVVVLVFTFFARNLNKLLTSLSERLGLSADQTNDASRQVAEASSSLAQGASEQASSLEETRASLESMSETTGHNADNAQEASKLTSDTRRAADKGSESMKEMIEAMDAIKQSSNDISAIIKTIDEIAFQTNILALNAAVEAARAGEAGQGFAVVADEVRALAQRSAVAARETSEKIEDAIHNSEHGMTMSRQAAEQLQRIVERIHKIDQFVSRIAEASTEQKEGISQITEAVTQMDELTQSSAASAEETASASEQLSAQSEELTRMVSELIQIVRGTNAQHQHALHDQSRHHNLALRD